MEKENKPSVLYLVLKRKWFDMIAAGIKKEEYRDYTVYWDRRLLRWKDVLANSRNLAFKKILFPGKSFIDDYYRHFDRIHFSLGYSSAPDRNMEFQCEGIRCGFDGKVEWGAPTDGKPYYIIKIGKRII